MDKIIKSFFILIIIAISSNIGVAEFDNIDYHGNPSYSIITYPKHYAVDKGDTVKVNIHITGVGDVDANKLWISIPPKVVKGNIELIEYIFDFDKKQPISPPTSYSLENFFGGSLSEEYFKIVKEPFISFGEPLIKVDGKKEAPVAFMFNVSDNAPEGDHEILIILFYKNGTQWYQSQETVEIHVNYWHEEHIIQYAIIIALLGAIVTVVVSFIWNFISKRIKGTES